MIQYTNVQYGFVWFFYCYFPCEGRGEDDIQSIFNMSLQVFFTTDGSFCLAPLVIFNIHLTLVNGPLTEYRSDLNCEIVQIV